MNIFNLLKFFLISNRYSQSDNRNEWNKVLRSYSDKQTFSWAFHEEVLRGLNNLDFPTFFSKIKHKISRIWKKFSENSTLQLDHIGKIEGIMNVMFFYTFITYWFLKYNFKRSIRNFICIFIDISKTIIIWGNLWQEI